MKLQVTNRNEGKFYSDGTRKPPNWEYKFETASIGGKRQRISKSGFPTKGEATREGTKAMNEYYAKGHVVKPSEMSVSDYLDLWLEKYVKQELKDSSYISYKKVIENHIKPILGKYALNTISPSIIQDFIYTKFNEGYSLNRLANMKGLLSGSFGYAVEPLEYLTYNPCINVKLPSKRATPKTETRSKTKRPVTDEEWNKIISRFAEGQTAHIPLILGYRCGLRLGEVFGLFWSDIDFDKKTLTVNRQVQDVNKQWVFTRPKYDSTRTISLDDSTLELLKRERERQINSKEVFKEDKKQLYVVRDSKKKNIESGYISEVGTEKIDMIMQRLDGSYIQPRIMQHTSRIIHGYGKDDVISADFDFHSLRHTHASKLIESGVPMVSIQKRLGHTKIDVTSEYIHETNLMASSLSETINNIYKC